MKIDMTFEVITVKTPAVWSDATTALALAIYEKTNLRNIMAIICDDGTKFPERAIKIVQSKLNDCYAMARQLEENSNDIESDMRWERMCGVS